MIDLRDFPTKRIIGFINKRYGKMGLWTYIKKPRREGYIFYFNCPLCFKILSGHQRKRKRNGYITLRKSIRMNTGSHIRNKHPELTDREKTEIIDITCNGEVLH